MRGGCGLLIFIFGFAILMTFAEICDKNSSKEKALAAEPHVPYEQSTFEVKNIVQINEIYSIHGSWYTGSSKCIKKVKFTIYNGGERTLNNLYGRLQVYKRKYSEPFFNKDGIVESTLVYSKPISMSIDLQPKETSKVTYEIEDEICDMIYTKTDKNYNIVFRILGEYSEEK